MDELTYDRDLAYSDEGQLIGHLVMAVSLLEEKVREAEKLSGESIPVELVLRLKHIIVSHHGEYRVRKPQIADDPRSGRSGLPGQPGCEGRLVPSTDARRPERRQPVDQFQSEPGRKLFKGGIRE